MKARAPLLITLTLAAVAASAAASPHRDGRDAAGPLDLTRVELRQDGPELVLRIGTAGAWSPGEIKSSLGRYLCLRLTIAAASAPQRQLCVGAARKAGRAKLDVADVGPTGQPIFAKRLSATVSRSDRSSLTARFLPAAAGLKLGGFRWQAASAWSGAGCPLEPTPESATCQDSLPDGGATVPATVRRAELSGCGRGRPLFRRFASRSRKVVALTFDDGPSSFTGPILNVLKRLNAKATFFTLGKEIPGREALLRRMVAEGSEIGNHSFSHPPLPSYGQLTSTTAKIRQATGFAPCLFRPPYGAINGNLIANANRAGMMTITWDVDPQDWRTSGTGAIYGNIVANVQSGSIVLTHDGGGPRGQTLAALPGIIKTLRARGYSFVTVTEALGYDYRWRLVG